MSAAHDKDIASLSGIFGPPWTREALGEVLAHHDGDKMAAVETILAHRSAHPDRVLRGLREASAAAASSGRDEGGGKSPPPRAERLPAPSGGASRDGTELEARGGNLRSGAESPSPLVERASTASGGGSRDETKLEARGGNLRSGAESPSPRVDHVSTASGGGSLDKTKLKERGGNLRSGAESPPPRVERVSTASGGASRDKTKLKERGGNRRSKAESPPPRVGHVSVASGGASRDEAKLKTRGGNRRSEAGSSADVAAPPSEGMPTKDPAFWTVLDNVEEPELPPEVEAEAATTRKRPTPPPPTRRPCPAVRAEEEESRDEETGADGAQGFSIVATAERVVTSNDAPVVEATPALSNENVPCCSCNLPGCSCNLRLGGGNRKLQLTFVALAAVVVIIVGVLSAKGIFTPTPSLAEEQVTSTIYVPSEAPAADLTADPLPEGQTTEPPVPEPTPRPTSRPTPRPTPRPTRIPILMPTPKPPLTPTPGPTAAPETTVGRIVKLTASDLPAQSAFGWDVAISGNTLVVGAKYLRTLVVGANGTLVVEAMPSGSGSVYVFTRTGATWTRQARLHYPGAAKEDGFGWAVAISDDTIVTQGSIDTSSGDSAYVFARTGTSWTQQAELVAANSTLDSSSAFGSAVSVSGDTAVIGDRWDDNYSGSAYVFTRTSTTWTQQAKLTATDAADGDRFGYSVAVSGDTAVVGTVFGDSAYVFERRGTTWTQQAKLEANDTVGDSGFGDSVAVSGDTIVIGAHYDDEVKGSAYVFTRTSSGWIRQAKLTASDGADDDFFGVSVAVSGDKVIIGAYGTDEGTLEDAGSAYVFKRSGTAWSEVLKLKATDASEDDYFGGSVAALASAPSRHLLSWSAEMLLAPTPAG